jgi:FecR protein
MNTAKNIIIILSICLAACLMLVSEASYAVDAGHAQFVIGSVQITSAAGQTSVLKKGDAVKEGDTLTTADAASAQIKMLDDGLIAVRPNTKLKFDTFKFNGTQDGSERSFFSLFTGGFRAVTGLIGQQHKPNFRITTTAATIGIRGTDHETYVVTADSPMAAVAPIGTYNKVNRGETTMTTTKGTISVLPNQMGFVGAANQMPKLQPLNTRIFTVSDRPLTEAKGDKKEGKEAKETASVDKTGKKETAVEVASSAKSNDGKEVRVAATEADAVTAVNWGDQDGSIKNTNQVAGKEKDQVAGKEKIAAPTPTVSDTNTYTNIVGPGNSSTNNQNSEGANLNAAPTPTVSGTNTYTNIVGPGNSSTNNPNSVGGNLNGAPTPTVADTNTYTNIVGPGNSSANNPNSAGANLNGQLHRH